MNSTKRFISITLGTFAALYIANLFFGPLLIQNLTVSAPIGVYRRSLGKPEIGDYVLCRLPAQIKGLIPADDTLLIKKIIAKQGAVYEVGFSNLTINGCKYPIHPLKKMPRPAIGKFTVPQNKVMVINDSPVSFDSRYFGPIDENDILGKISLIIDYDKVAKILERWMPQ